VPAIQSFDFKKEMAEVLRCYAVEHMNTGYY
jgi:hypothetical protein